FVRSAPRIVKRPSMFHRNLKCTTTFSSVRPTSKTSASSLRPNFSTIPLSLRRSDGRCFQIAVVQLAGAIRRRGAGRRGGSGGVGAQRLPSARAGNRKRLGGGRERRGARHVPILKFQPHAVVPFDPPLTK
ncbi:unnamed protein product, partial [Nesidiocoris tenuis]